MVRGIGEDSFEDLLPWLMETLASENNSVDRSGAAQGMPSSHNFLVTVRLSGWDPSLEPGDPSLSRSLSHSCPIQLHN